MTTQAEMTRDQLACLVHTGKPATLYLKDGRVLDGRVFAHPRRPRWFRVDDGPYFQQSQVADIIPL